MRRLSDFLLLLSVAACLLFAAPASAQEAGDTLSVACPPPRVAELCVDLDATLSVDSAAGPLTFRWLMGDGTTLTGTQVSHCYTARRLYTVQLDVLDEKTGEVRTAEKLLPIDFTKEIVLNFSATPTSVRVGQPVVFDALDSQLPLCENVVVLWDFRDGAVTNGRRVQHTFRRPGQYPVRMALRGNGPDTCPTSHCVSQIVTVTVAP